MNVEVQSNTQAGAISQIKALYPDASINGTAQLQQSSAQRAADDALRTAERNATQASFKQEAADRAAHQRQMEQKNQDRKDREEATRQAEQARRDAERNQRQNTVYNSTPPPAPAKKDGIGLLGALAIGAAGYALGASQSKDTVVVTTDTEDFWDRVDRENNEAQQERMNAALNAAPDYPDYRYTGPKSTPAVRQKFCPFIIAISEILNTFPKAQWSLEDLRHDFPKFGGFPENPARTIPESWVKRLSKEPGEWDPCWDSYTKLLSYADYPRLSEDFYDNMAENKKLGEAYSASGPDEFEGSPASRINTDINFCISAEEAFAKIELLRAEIATKHSDVNDLRNFDSPPFKERITREYTAKYGVAPTLSSTFGDTTNFHLNPRLLGIVEKWSEEKRQAYINQRLAYVNQGLIHRKQALKQEYDNNMKGLNIIFAFIGLWPLLMAIAGFAPEHSSLIFPGLFLLAGVGAVYARFRGQFNQDLQKQYQLADNAAIVLTGV